MLFLLAVPFTYAGGEENQRFGIDKQDRKHLLVLHDDMTFSYENTLGGEAISASGKYSRKGKVIKLIPQTENAGMISRWKLNKEGDAVTSRKGLTFYRLANCH